MKKFKEGLGTAPKMHDIINAILKRISRKLYLWWGSDYVLSKTVKNGNV